MQIFSMLSEVNIFTIFGTFKRTPTSQEKVNEAYQWVHLKLIYRNYLYVKRINIL